MSIARVLGDLRKNIDSTETRITSGTIKSVSPLKIEKDKLEITEDYLIMSPVVEFMDKWEPLKSGDEVILLQANRQQTYYILEILKRSFPEELEEYTQELIDISVAAAESRMRAYVNSKL